MGRKVVQETPHAADGKRLRAVRLALGHDVLEHYARAAGMASNLYGMHETGVRPITLERARALKHHYRLPLDFIFDGDLYGLPHELVRKYQEKLAKLKQ